MVVRFHIQKDGTRVPMEYNSYRERAWCECQELYEAEFYEEAYKKLDEYHEINGGFINKFDWPMILKIEVGYLKVKPTELNFKNSKNAWINAAFYVEDDERMAFYAHDMVDSFVHKIPKEYDDFSKCTPEETAKVLDFMLSIIRMGNEKQTDFRSTDFLYEFSFGIRDLREKGATPKALELFEEVKNLSYYSNFFINKDNPFEDD